MSAYDHDLDKNPANYQPLTPLGFLERAAAVFPDHPAIIHGLLRRTYRDFATRARRLATALAARGVAKGDTVSTMLANTPEMLEAHYGVPLTGAVLNTLNVRLDAATIAFILDHAETKVLLTDREFSRTIKAALAQAKAKPLVIDVDDPVYKGEGERLGETDYEAFIAEAEPHPWTLPADEWDAISLNYTSGTTGNPKGVVYHHRGAHLLAVGNVLAASMPRHAVYLWTLPMFHCNGWCFPWTVSVLAGTHVCLRRVEARPMYDAIADHGVTHLCGAPIVMSMLSGAAASDRRDLGARTVEFMTAAAPPPEAVLARMAESGFNVTHLYGLTETYGPAVVNEWHEAWNALDAPARAARKARQGVRYSMLDALSVMDPETMRPVPPDGETIGEVMFRGNVVMKGYLKNPKASAEAFAGGWFHSGDLGVMHADGYIQLKDRSKDIIISGGENISSIEVEDAIYKHPAVAAVAVVAKPDDKWGETPCAFIELTPGQSATPEDITTWCRDRLAGYKVPRHIVFEDLPKTSTGKVQKFVLRERAKGV